MNRRLVLLIATMLGLIGQPAGAEASTLFQPVYDVLTHPRCLNCHTRTNFPRQGDERRRHDQLVMRGEEDHGSPALPCSACHQDHNVADGAVPGAPHWELAPLSMAWEDLNPEQLCEVLKNRSLNGDRSLEVLVEHMDADALVLWGWEPGGNRSTPPLDHPEFMVALRAWADAGGPCR